MENKRHTKWNKMEIIRRSLTLAYKNLLFVPVFAEWAMGYVQEGEVAGKRIWHFQWYGISCFALLANCD